MLQHVVSALGHNSGDCILEFLSVLPEEVTEGRKISLSVCTVGRLWAYARLEGSSNFFDDFLGRGAFN